MCPSKDVQIGHFLEYRDTPGNKSTLIDCERLGTGTEPNIKNARSNANRWWLCHYGACPTKEISFEF